MNQDLDALDDKADGCFDALQRALAVLLPAARLWSGKQARVWLALRPQREGVDLAAALAAEAQAERDLRGALAEASRRLDAACDARAVWLRAALDARSAGGPS